MIESTKLQLRGYAIASASWALLGFVVHFRWEFGAIVQRIATPTLYAVATIARGVLDLIT